MKEVPQIKSYNNKKVLWVDGKPFIALGAEITWFGVKHGRYRQTQSAHDYLYPAARKMGMNCILVAVKWDQIEPERGKFDFSYIRHIIKQCEKNKLKLIICWFGHNGSGIGTIYSTRGPRDPRKGEDHWLDNYGNIVVSSFQFAPTYIINDHEKYPRCVDGDGKVYANTLCYSTRIAVEEEIKAYSAMMRFLKKHDKNQTTIMIQLENEISPISVTNRDNPKFWRCHCDKCNRLFKQRGFDDDLKFSAWWMSKFLIKPLSDAGHKAYPIPQYLNFVGCVIAHWMVGGAPGEDVKTALDICPHISFCGINLYIGPTTGNSDLKPLDRYRIGRNLIALSEANSDITLTSPRNVYEAVGEYSCVLYAPWAMEVSTPIRNAPYVLKNGSLDNGAFELRDSYEPLVNAMCPAAKWAGTERIISFNFTRQWKNLRKMGDTYVTLEMGDQGRGLMIHPKKDEFIILGTRFKIKLHPYEGNFQCERGYFKKFKWIKQGRANYLKRDNSLTVIISKPQVVRLYRD